MTYKERTRLGLLQAEADLRLALKRWETAKQDLADWRSKEAAPTDEYGALQATVNETGGKVRAATIRHGLWALAANFLVRS